jgi:chloramphenicol 3-O-phosphotransferase
MAPYLAMLPLPREAQRLASARRRAADAPVRLNPAAVAMLFASVAATRCAMLSRPEARMGSIIVLSGPIGAGKTTVARELVRTAERPTAFIEGDVFWTFIVKGHPSRPRERGFRTLMRAMISSAAAFAADDFEVILDFSIPPYFLRAAAERLGESDIHFVVLKPPEAVCAARAASRDEGVIADYGPHNSFYAAFEAEPRHVIDNAARPPQEVAAGIRDGVRAGTFRFG